MPSVNNAPRPTVPMRHPERFRNKTRHRRENFRQSIGDDFDVSQFIVANALAVLVAQLTVALLLE